MEKLVNEEGRTKFSTEFLRATTAFGVGLGAMAAAATFMGTGIGALAVGGIIAISQYSMSRQSNDEQALALRISQAAMATVMAHATAAMIQNGVPPKTSADVAATIAKLNNPLSYSRSADDVVLNEVTVNGKAVDGSLASRFTVTVGNAPEDTRIRVVDAKSERQYGVAKRVRTAVPVSKA